MKLLWRLLSKSKVQTIVLAIYKPCNNISTDELKQSRLKNSFSKFLKKWLINLQWVLQTLILHNYSNNSLFRESPVDGVALLRFLLLVALVFPFTICLKKYPLFSSNSLSIFSNSSSKLTNWSLESDSDSYFSLFLYSRSSLDYQFHSVSAFPFNLTKSWYWSLFWSYKVSYRVVCSL